jgi:hypothetical protein
MQITGQMLLAWARAEEHQLDPKSFGWLGLGGRFGITYCLHFRAQEEKLVLLHTYSVHHLYL